MWEIGDSLDEEHGPLRKRSKNDEPLQQPMEDDAALLQQLLNEPGTLGLRLKKTKSALDLFEMELSQTISGTRVTSTGETAHGETERDMTSAGKTKATQFDATHLIIGTWERVARYGSDLVAKCYFRKRKLVWEFLEGGMKSKIEIPWPHIKGLKVTYPEGGDGTLDIELSKPPLFYVETDPQPRKHTFWRPTTDFTGLQASMHRHILKCTQGSLSKHMEKIFQCDPRLYLLSQQPEPQHTVFADQLQAKDHGFDNMKNGNGSTISESCISGWPYASSSMSMNSMVPVSAARVPDVVSQETLLPSTGILEPQAWKEHGSAASAIEEPEETNWWDQEEEPSFEELMHLLSDVPNPTENCTPEMMTSGNPSTSSNTQPDNIPLHLSTDSGELGSGMVMEDGPDTVPATTRVVDAPELPISRQDSLQEFMEQLPRIASLPILPDPSDFCFYEDS